MGLRADAGARLRAGEFLAAGPAALIEVAGVQGSTPRETDAWMLVSADDTRGTIGGGRLEQMAIERAREALRDHHDASIDVPLGPEIGQCCGGRVALRITLDTHGVAEREQAERALWPHVFVFGHGHVGRALMPLLVPLPVHAHSIETRPDFARDGEATALPETEIDAAPPGSAFVFVTHDHALDYLLVDRALARADAAYIGLIGSATKRATFASRFARDGHPPERFEQVACPIGRLGGAIGSNDKRPEVIATFIAAEVAAALLR